MKLYILWIAACMLSCNDADNSLATENDQLKKENDSLKHLEKPVVADESDTKIDSITPVEMPLEKGGTHPITLQWISWDKPGVAILKPATGGWYTITGSQANADDYLKINGRIKRVSEKELEFDGTIEIKVSHNNQGEPCIKKGTQQFFAKGSRKYFRMQNMTNCEGGSLVDYVDIYPGTSSL